ncbi:hypothetical protein MTYP_02235 [Methylophilaceae bacterium]|nr:hypothetical protein MTYP_02235 [Methylophilaceae bacterium]
MKWIRVFIAASLLFVAQVSFAEVAINTQGSDQGIAISGFDTVAFFTENRAVKGNPEIAAEWKGAKWLFASQDHLNLFKADPEKYAPQWGGFCAVGVSEGRISKKAVNGEFDIQNGKLYLFPVHKTGTHDGVKKDWYALGGGPATRIADGDTYWPSLKATREDGRRSSWNPDKPQNAQTQK